MSLTLPTCSDTEITSLLEQCKEAILANEYEKGFLLTEKAALGNQDIFGATAPVLSCALTMHFLSPGITGSGDAARCETFYGALGEEITRLRKLKNISAGRFFLSLAFTAAFAVVILQILLNPAFISPAFAQGVFNLLPGLCSLVCVILFFLSGLGAMVVAALIAAVVIALCMEFITPIVGLWLLRIGLALVLLLIAGVTSVEGLLNNAVVFTGAQQLEARRQASRDAIARYAGPMLAHIKRVARNAIGNGPPDDYLPEFNKNFPGALDKLQSYYCAALNE